MLVCAWILAAVSGLLSDTVLEKSVLQLCIVPWVFELEYFSLPVDENDIVAEICG